MKKNRKASIPGVVLVGAGPGDPGLLTLRGLEKLQEADVIIYDRLIPEEILNWNPLAEKIFVGKYSHRGKKKKRLKHPHTDQETINKKIVQFARKGLFVVRLKGGDPFVFGRGGEEVSYLEERNIPFEIVPGVSAGVAVPAYAGIPVTDRRFNTAVTFVTGHTGEEDGASNIPFEELAKSKGTLVFFMPVANLATIVDSLQSEGLSRRTPVAIIERGATFKQRVIEGTLASIAKKAETTAIKPPALLVIGEAVRLRKHLNWFENKSLLGKRVLVMRPEKQSSRLAHLLSEQGAGVVQMPSIEIQSPTSWTKVDQAIRNIQEQDWILFTSVNGVEAFCERLYSLKKDARSLQGVKIAAVGPATKNRLKDYGLRADLIPFENTVQGLLKELKIKKAIKGRRFLLPRTQIAPPYLVENLKKLGGEVTPITVYRTLKPKGLNQALKKAFQKPFDFLFFTSASTVKHLLGSLSRNDRKKVTPSHCVAIGPITRQTLREHGIRSCKMAQEPTLEALVEAAI